MEHAAEAVAAFSLLALLIVSALLIIEIRNRPRAQPKVGPAIRTRTHLKATSADELHRDLTGGVHAMTAVKNFRKAYESIK